MTVAGAAGVTSARVLRPAQALNVWPVALAGLAVWALALLIHAPLKLDHDESYFLASGRILNEGARLYTDWIDFNTTAPSGVGRYSAWLASVLHTPLDLTHKSTILLLVLSGLGITCAVLAPLLRQAGPARWVLGIGIPAVLLFATPEIGRREHLLCVGLLGWAASIVLAGQGVRRPWPVAVIAGLAAGLALYEKPHFALFGLALGMVDLARAGWRPDRLLVSTWVAAAVSAALYAWLVAANPELLAVVLPAASDLYSPLGIGHRETALQLAQHSGVPAAILIFAAAALKRESETGLGWPAQAVAIAFAVTAVVLFIQQGFGFDYHRLPLDIAFNLIALGLVAWALRGGVIGVQRPLPVAGLVAAGLVLVVSMGLQLNDIRRYPHREVVLNSPLLAAARPPRPGDPILIVTTDINMAAETLTFLDVKWSGAFVSHFPIPLLIRQNGRNAFEPALPEEKRERWTGWFMDKVSEKFCERLPVRVVVETTWKPIFFQNPGFDMLAWLREDSAFDTCWQAARLFPAGEPFEVERHTYQGYAPR